MNAATTRLLRGVALASATVLAAAGASSTSAVGLDPSIYDTGVPFGSVEHGVLSYTITGTRDPMNRRIEYWNTADRYREQVTDARTGELIAGRLHDASGTTWLQYKPINGDPKVLHFKGNDSVPGPGYPAPYNRKLATTGVPAGSDADPINQTLQPIGPRTIAGFAGTAYEQLSNGVPGLHGGEAGTVPGSHAILVLQDGTYQPLMREFSAPNGAHGSFVQREILLSRQTTPAAQASVKLTKASFAKTTAVWRAKVKAAIKKKHHKK
ncbi:hypothetical protein [Baekduia sp. Peel2402]|uniref:hypothetical protein n=1 Tax=Baekduia sp. Peel2402 TaxID=3458296 RepID=UPI00403EC618